MKPTLSNSLLYLMSITAGLVVANLYYSQPLLHLISVEFNVSESAVSNVALFTQLGYAFGLLFIIPLGDKISNHTILQYDFGLMIIALLATAFSNSLLLLIVSSFFVGFSSSIPQLFVPMAAQLSNSENRGRSIGIVMSGLLIGILGSRIISGFVGEIYGWRTMYFAATALMLLLFVVLMFKLPKLTPNYKGSYSSLMRSLWYYFKKEPSLRLATIKSALAFAGLCAFWTTLVFLMEENFNYGSSVTGAFGLFGIIGAFGATVVGKLNNKVNKNKIILISAFLLLVSWVVFLVSANSLVGIAIGVILVDLGLQALHITNQNIIFSKNEDARNRVNTIYMVGFFIGGALGTSLGAIMWQHFKWTGVASLGIFFSILIIGIQLIYNKKNYS
ncbi:MFS transporter [Polaribacter glomeratus]|uniref:MFS transporter n=1 Tax=Polaribacter glomeratus TaxID=102 RepID=A0A2S7WG59_9FLAO|nr:MFS transporter [Polaribacter glomeratus]PQJ76396.1 MFS transporter [Polaribacter glomeratus]TXD65529.1 MFS transporter [Polaribacter glomeratus]